MTYDEYKALVDEWTKTDSLKARREIDDRIDDTAVELLHVLTALYRKYGQHFVDDSDYLEDRGHISMTGFDEDCVNLLYSDRWAYGGECDISISVPMKYLDRQCLEELEAELQSNQIKQLRLDKEATEKEIDNLRKQLVGLEAKLEELEQGEQTCQ